MNRRIYENKSIKICFDRKIFIINIEPNILDKIFQNRNSYSISRSNLIVVFDSFPNFNNTYFFKYGYRLFFEYVELKENDMFSS